MSLLRRYPPPLVPLIGAFVFAFSATYLAANAYVGVVPSLEAGVAWECPPTTFMAMQAPAHAADARGDFKRAIAIYTHNVWCLNRLEDQLSAYKKRFRP